MATLPLDVTSDILSRLPVKSLLRFRCVSKPFSSLIDSPEFAKLHLNRSIETNSNLSLILSGTENCVSVPYGVWFGKIFSSSLDSLDIAVKLNHPFGNSRVQIIGSCNGLIALKNREGVIALWNPSTKKYQMVPKFWSDYRSCDDVLDGFGYDEASDDYKLVRIIQFHKNWVVEYTEAFVYSLKTNSSRRINGFPYYFLRIRECAFVAGALHWLASQTPRACEEDLIAAFDLKKEEFYQLPLPPDRKLLFVLIKTVNDVGGSLCLSPFVGDAVSGGVWIMKEYGVKESWTRLVSIPQYEVIGCFDYVKALTYSKSGDEILLDKFLCEKDEFELYWYNLKNQSARRSLKIPGVPLGSRDTIVCLDSLVSVDAYTRIGVQRQSSGQKRKKQLEEVIQCIVILLKQVINLIGLIIVSLGLMILDFTLEHNPV